MAAGSAGPAQLTTSRRTGGRVVGLVAGLAALTVACTPSLAERPRTDQERGRAHLVAYGCTSCHRVPGIAVPQGQVGPPLGAFGERRVIAGLLPNNPENAALYPRPATGQPADGDARPPRHGAGRARRRRLPVQPPRRRGRRRGQPGSCHEMTD